MNAEISAFSSGDLNKYELLKRIDLNYKPNALDKARFEFSPLGKTISMGLDKTAQGYQKEGVVKILKNIRDGLRGGVRPLGPDDNNDDNNDNNNDNNNDDDNDNNNDNNYDDYDYGYDDYMPYYNDDDRPDYNNMSNLKTEEKASEKILTNALDKLENDIETEMSNLDKIVKNKENEFSAKLNKLNNDVKKIDNYIKENNDKIIKKEKEYNEIFLKYN